ncbi:hypothetical protein HBI56_143170 [Parastagonospora nodorum]|nr:hypothetical protein HBH53_044480 [Parastagonospora nodorum]KAH3980461.1 hypothetical protein HBH52_091660 [Parastagonospora nodorum]KAH4075854.1 hypothetical protein HBH50_022560 [Parastagonospora nodorum]KAH4097839.1 hypothetical protein HBH48_024700 [Parastagonospora nodorum]KAH4108492.1 hypothetical protein HBH46_045560 [Parastagonospora nodorum]
MAPEVPVVGLCMSDGCLGYRCLGVIVFVFLKHGITRRMGVVCWHYLVVTSHHNGDVRCNHLCCSPSVACFVVRFSVSLGIIRYHSVVFASLLFSFSSWALRRRILRIIKVYAFFPPPPAYHLCGISVRSKTLLFQNFSIASERERSEGWFARDGVRIWMHGKCGPIYKRICIPLTVLEHVELM